MMKKFTRQLNQRLAHWPGNGSAWLLVLVFVATTVAVDAQIESPLTHYAYQSNGSNAVVKRNENKIKGFVTLKTENANLSDVLAQIEKQSDYVFIYTDDEVDRREKYSLNVANEPLDKLLTKILYPINVKFQLYGRQIVLHATTASNPTVAEEAAEASSTIEVITISGQTEATETVSPVATGRLKARVVYTVTGTVTDENNQGLPGVNVLEKGTSNGTVANADGVYTIDVTDANATLTFSYIGYATQDVPVNGQATINLSMQLDIQSLNEVVVVGYGEQKRSNITGAIASVKGSEITNLPVRSVGDAIQGRVAGVFVTAEGGNPGSTGQIVIRGPGNIRGVQPLYVVDGVPFVGTGFNFNMQDVESIEVLKDASAAAIYGAQASGGVILITTKKGKAGKLKVGFNANYGIREALNIPDLLQRDDYIRAKIAAGVVASQFGDPNQYSTLPDTDWFDELFNTGKEQNYTVSLSGGSEKSNFYLSSNYQRLDGVRIGNSLERYTFRINSDHQLSKRVKIGQTLYGSYTKEDPTQVPNQGVLNFRSTPLMTVYDPTNVNGGGWGRVPAGFQGGNPVGDEYSHDNPKNNYNINLSGYFEWELINDLRFRVNAATTLDNNNNYYFNKRADFGFGVSQESFGREFYKQQQFMVNYTLNYAKTFGVHEVAAMVGYEARKKDEAWLKGNSYFPLLPNQQNFTFVTNELLNRPESNGRDNYRLLSQFARVNYIYSGKYIFEANVRRDGNATAFGPSNKYGVFPSAALGWRISEEAFMSSLEEISNLKLRVTYGTLGNSDIPSFLFLADYDNGYTADFGGGVTKGFGVSNKLPNQDIQWEIIKTFDIGIDAGLFENKLTVSLDWYNRDTEKMLYDIPLPRSTGLGDVVSYNIGEMNNTGFEFNANYITKLGDVNLNFGFNGAFNRNKLISLSNDLEKQELLEGDLNEFYNNAQINRSVPNEPLGQFWGLIADGIYATDAEAAEGPKVGDYTPRAGDLRYRDIKADGFITEDDKTFIGNPWPKFTYGITLGADWKGIDARLFFTGVSGVDIYNAYESFQYSFYNDYNSTPKIFETSFFAGNGVTDKPRSADLSGSGDPNGNWGRVSSYHVQDGGFLRLKNFQVGYSLPNSITDKIKASSFRIFFMADNLFTITKYKGIDPESSLGSASAADQPRVRRRGVDAGSNRYPMTRLYSLGVNIEF